MDHGRETDYLRATAMLVGTVGLVVVRLASYAFLSVAFLTSSLFAALYHIISIPYNLTIHPLARFPGPIARRVSRIPYTLALLRGTAVPGSVELHRRYGPLVRVAPDELAFADPRAWRDVMGGGGADLPKWAGMYRVPAFLPPHMQNTTSKAHHRMLRKAVAPGFSDASLRAQEPLISRYVDLLIRRLREKCCMGERTDEEGGVVNMELWYRYVIFDIICDLTVGESFGCLESDDLHPWVKAMIDGGKTMWILTAVNMYEPLAGVVNSILGVLARNGLDMHKNVVKPMMEKRLEAGDRPDLINPILRMKGEGRFTMDEIVSQALVIVGAGAETSASILTAVTGFLLDNPDKLARLAREVRSAFASESEINFDAVAKLPYLVACLDEALRLFPQTGAPSLRVAERDTMICGVKVPQKTIVGIWPWALNRNPALFTDPDEFSPERFTGDPKYASDARDGLKPFFTGSRDCIGQNLALLEMRLILARMVYNFDMKPARDPESRNWARRQKNLFIVWQKSPLPVSLTPVR